MVSSRDVLEWVLAYRLVVMLQVSEESLLIRQVIMALQMVVNMAVAYL